MPDGHTDALRLFLRDGSERIARIASPALASAVPAAFRPAAASVGRQAAGGWIVEAQERDGFLLSSAMREFLVPTNFAGQCAHVRDMVTRSRNPELRGALAQLEDPSAAVLSAFFHYFVIHELLHVEQGLGSDQYKDSELYMPIVMEADHVADVAGLAIAVTADVPELAALDAKARMLVLIAVHIAAMYGFNNPASMDAYAFSRLLVWFVHFARFCKAPAAPHLASQTMLRPWIISLPRLIGREDHQITAEGLDARVADPYPATSDVVLAYHQEDGLYRIHRAALTDPARIRRLCGSILDGKFDAVREDLEELLVNNPALVPAPDAHRAPAVEWAAGIVLDRLEALGPLIARPGSGTLEAADEIVKEFNRLVAAIRSAGTPSPAVSSLVSEGRATLELLREQLEGITVEGDSPARLRRRGLSIIEQIVQEHAADYSV